MNMYLTDVYRPGTRLYSAYWKWYNFFLEVGLYSGCDRFAMSLSTSLTKNFVARIIASSHNRILFSGHPGISVNELSPLSLRRWNIRHFTFDFHRLKMTDSLLEEVTSPRKREFDANIKLAYPYNKVFNPVNLVFLLLSIQSISIRLTTSCHIFVKQLMTDFNLF